MESQNMWIKQKGKGKRKKEKKKKRNVCCGKGG